MTRVFIDFEVASELDLNQVGVDVWTKSPKTILIVASYAVDLDDVQTFLPELLDDQTLLDLAAQPHVQMHAWNANFEFNVWNNICVPRYGWPGLPIERWHCTMATAACAGLPMNLHEAALAVGSPHLKSASGHDLMLRMARPRGFNANGAPRWWHIEDPARLKQLAEYNRADVLAEREVCRRIPRMSDREREIWLTDQRMNAKGMPLDEDLLTQLHAITLEELLRLGQRLNEVTHGEVRSATHVGALLKWVKDRGYPFDTLERKTLAPFLQTPKFRALPGAVRDALKTRDEAGKTSTAKLKSLAAYAQNGVARNLVQYGGAVRTLRWAGRGPQIQNFPRPVVKHVYEAICEIKSGADAMTLQHIFGRPLDVVSSCLRGVFAAPPGYRFVVCDYKSVEAIVIAWLADFDDMLDVFRRGDDVYTFTAQSIGSNSRPLGKVMRLGLNYGMGHAKFRDTARLAGIELEENQARSVVDAFRRANKPIVELWRELEACARQAIWNSDETFTYKRISFRMGKPDRELAGALLMRLPSGRRLVYRNARVHNGRVVFQGVHQTTHRWGPQDTYGGKLAENATQACARDLLAEAMVAFDRMWPNTLCATVHDEIVALVPDEEAPVASLDLNHFMSTSPAWGDGLPLSATGGVVERYGKL
jgi:DNA polymerase bacteriophage-type